MGVKDRAYQFIEYLNIPVSKFEEICGLSNGYISSMRKGFGTGKLDNVLNKFPDLRRDWILYGEGEMLKNCGDDTVVSYEINQKHKGIPYYDVDFIGGFDLVENDQTINPTYHIEFAAYAKADCWVNITGHSMEPQIEHGDIIALKKIEDWQTYILYGEIYAIVTDEYRTVKKIRRSTKGDDYLRFVPINPEYDEQDIAKSIIRHVYKVIGCAKKVF